MQPVVTMPNRIINEIILHCTATMESQKVTLEMIRRWHIIERGWGDVGYHFIVDRDGSVWEGRPLHQQGAHCKGHNAFSIGVCYVGGLEDETASPKDTRTAEQKIALNRLVRDLMHRFGLRKQHVHAHYEYAKRACPCFDIQRFKDELYEY